MPPHEESLGDGLVLRTVRDAQDAERFVAFYASLFGARSAVAPAYLPYCHPRMGLANLQFIEDTRNGQVVSTTCLIPWLFRYEDIRLSVAMLEFVATHPDYRHRGLVRTQVRRFHEMAEEQHFDLDLIEGIPYYYRQFGYAYAIDHRGADSLAAWCVPDPAEGWVNPFETRRATPTDAPALLRLYEQAMAGLQVHVLRDLDYWRFLLERVQVAARLVMDRRDGTLVGYYCTQRGVGVHGVRVMESAITSCEAAMAVLHELKREYGGDIQLGWPQCGTLIQLGRSLGGRPQPPYQWLLRIPDLARFLARIAPVLERRLAESDCAGLTAELCVNLFREAYLLRFERGKLNGVDPLGFVDASMGADGGDLCIPPDAFVRLIFGYRTLDELRDAWPDIVIRPASRHLLDVLFPRLSSYLCVVYDYCGPDPSAAPA